MGSREGKLREHLLRHSRYSTTEGWRWHRKARRNPWRKPRASESEKQLYTKVHGRVDRRGLSAGTGDWGKDWRTKRTSNQAAKKRQRKSTCSPSVQKTGGSQVKHKEIL